MAEAERMQLKLKHAVESLALEERFDARSRMRYEAESTTGTGS
jgi:hypothetical protein